ncbi:MAG: ATP-grasp domain-containing protein [Streptosporangiaceae bacterium]
MKLYVMHENPDWYAPLAAAFDQAGLPHEQWLLGEAVLDLDEAPPEGVYWSRMSASAHTRGHPFAKEQARGVLSWLRAHGRRVVNGRQALELEVSKAEQLIALRAHGLDVPRTMAVAGTADLAAAARKLPVPFISKHNQGGKGHGVRLFASHDEFDACLAGADYQPPADGITLLQEYLQAAEPRITRAELVGGEFIYALTADTARGGFELCPADACAADARGGAAGEAGAASLFTLRENFEHPITGSYARFCRQQGIEIAGFEFIETADGRLVTYDINTTTNYNAGIEAAAPRPALPAVAAFLGRLLAEAAAGETGQRRDLLTVTSGTGREGHPDAVRVLDADLRRLAAQRPG